MNAKQSLNLGQRNAGDGLESGVAVIQEGKQINTSSFYPL